MNSIMVELIRNENSDLSTIFQSNLALSFLNNRIEKIDGHGHSKFSDGDFTVNELADSIIKIKNASLILTDHNTVQHFYEINKVIFSSKYKYNPPLIIPGVEITCHFLRNRCHVIWLGGKMDGIFEDFIIKQRELYILRETDKLKLICSENQLPYSLRDYLTFCMSRTPNWTISYNYLLNLGVSTEKAKDLLRSARYVEKKNKWWKKIPSLSELYAFSQQQNALLFLCHLGDLIQKIEPNLLNNKLKVLPNLLFDLSARPEHAEVLPAVNLVPFALQRVKNQSSLIGTDYHNILPKPQKTELKLRSALLKILSSSDEFDFKTPISLITNPGLFASTIGGKAFLKNSDIFHAMNSIKINDWIDLFLFRKKSITKIRIVESIVSMAALKKLQSPLILSAIIKNKNEEINEHSIIRNLMNLIQINNISKLPSKSDLVTILSIGDTCLRIGQYALYSNLLNNHISMLPPNFINGYYANINSYTGQRIMSILWSHITLMDRQLFCNSKLIWRLKTPCSAFNTVSRNFIELGKSRHRISSEEIMNSATLLLEGKDKSESFCKKAYSNLIYDHLAATIIIPDIDMNYYDILYNISLPIGWEILDSEYLPRKSYHHRLWLLIKCQLDNEEEYIFELMIKKETDFYIGRSYQWYEKNCPLAISNSPWNEDGSFDRTMALAKWEKNKSVSSLLISEILEWKNNGKQNNK